MDCIFCKIANREMNTKIIRDDGDVVAFHDINPQAPVHVLVVPKQHIARITEMSKAEQKLVGKMIHVGQQTAVELGISESGFRLVLNDGPDANQTVLHIHLHVIGGRKMGWPPG